MLIENQTQCLLCTKIQIYFLTTIDAIIYQMCHTPSLHPGRGRHSMTIVGLERILGLACITQRNTMINNYKDKNSNEVMKHTNYECCKGLEHSIGLKWQHKS